MGVSQLGYVCLGVSNVSKWEDFAVEVLGTPVTRGSDGCLYLRMDEYHHRVMLLPGGADDISSIGWEVSTAGELESIVSRLRATGMEVTAGTTDEARRRKVVAFYAFNDPSGIRSEIFIGPLVQSEKPFHPTRAISGFRAGALGAGHLFLMVPDLDAATRFYCELLGFRISDYMDLSVQRPGLGNAVFLHCNPRHHTLALGQGRSAKKLRHLMIEVNSLDDIGATHDLAQGRSMLARSIGRHTNDQMVSIYLTTPSGFDIEYGWGGRSVHEESWVVQQYVAPSVWGHEAVSQPAPGSSGA